MRASSTAHRPDTDEPEDDERGAVGDAAERGQRAAGRSDPESARDDGNPTETIHQTPGRKRSERSRRKEDRGPQAKDRLDAGDENEGDRGDGHGELQNPGEREQAEPEEDGVTTYLPG